MGQKHRIRRRLQRHLGQLAPKRHEPMAPPWPRRRWKHWPQELRHWCAQAGVHRLEDLGPWQLNHALYPALPDHRWASLRGEPLHMLAFLLGTVAIGESHHSPSSVLIYTRARTWPRCGALYQWDMNAPLVLTPVAPSLARYLAVHRAHGPHEALDVLGGWPGQDDQEHPGRLLPLALWLMVRMGQQHPPQSLTQRAARALASVQDLHGPHLSVARAMAYAHGLTDAPPRSERFRQHPAVVGAAAWAQTLRPTPFSPEFVHEGASSMDHQRAFEAAVSSAERQFGRGVLKSMTQLAQEEPLEIFSTGLLTLDKALGIGGYPRGQIVEIYGPEASGKTTLTMHAIAAAQRAEPDKRCLYIDAERGFNAQWATALGIDAERLYVSRPDNGEQALEVLDMTVRSGGCSLAVVDSVAALVPRAEIEGDMGDTHVGLQAKLMSQAMRKLIGAVSDTRTTVIFTNQLRSKVGVLFGSPETTTGGNALKFYAGIRMDIRRIGAIKNQSGLVGTRHRIKLIKNSFGSPAQAEADLLFGRGFELANQVLHMAVEQGLVTRSGAWYDYDGERLGQGIQAVAQALRDQPALLESLRQRLT